MHKDVSRCVGLWLAEGDSTTSSEITFTNNLKELVILFDKTMTSIFGSIPNARIYVYSDDGREIRLPIKAVHKFYTDKRARKPYFIYRIANVKLVKIWKEIVRKTISNKKSYEFVLQGFFAGEGSVRFVRRCKSRVVRISQKSRNAILEKMLENFGIESRFRKEDREYEISNRRNLEKILKIGMTSLHRDKNSKFHSMMNCYKQRHYDKNFLKSELYLLLSVPIPTRELSEKFGRSKARISKVLGALKKESMVTNFRAGSRDFWVRANSNLIVISKVKSNLLTILGKAKTTAEVAKSTGKSWKSVYRRLNELEKLNLVKRNGKLWQRVPTEKRIVVR
ncbi:MAG: LAGLIDADG family homing endonuclease [Candidatus Aenigmatarchaeota archaeon]